jgi:hypothetical protein
MKRNPRRAYGKDGNEIASALVRDIKVLGCTTVCASCQQCGHEAVLDITDASDDRPVPDISLRLRCSRCNSRDIRTAMDMAEYYRVLHATTGWQPP